MDEALLSYYNRELAYLRQMGAEFADKHPKIAGRLRLDKDVVEDPHVSRLIESFAFLTGRIRQKLDDSFPELTQALMGVLNPDYHAPIPSLGITQIRTIPERPETQHVPAGTLLKTQSNPMGVCHYQTCFATDVWPIAVTDAGFYAPPFKAPNLRGDDKRKPTQGLLQVTLQGVANVPLAEVNPDHLRFFISAQPQVAFRLYEYLLNHLQGIAIGSHPNDPNTRYLSRDQLTACGFGEDEAALTMDGRASSAHRLLTEYFAFPEKFLFLRLGGLEGLWDGLDDTAQLYFYFDQHHPELVQAVDGDTLRLGCTPMINLFEARTEPLTSRELGFESRLEVDHSHQTCVDIHSIKRLYATNGQGEKLDLQPFYGAHRTQTERASPVHWHARREASQWFNGRISRGSEMWLSLVDRDFNVRPPEQDWVIYAEVRCTNRDLPDKLPFGPGQPKLDFCSGGAGLRLRAVTAPTATLLPRLGDATRWQLVTQLSMQHFSGEEGLQVLKETLKLYDFRQSPENQSVIDGVVGLRTRPCTRRIHRDGRAAICQGTEIHVELDDNAFSGSGLYLFSAMLSEFFAQYCAMNTFVQLITTVRQTPSRKIAWPPRTGKQTIL